jgi:hypothetical protein
VKAGAPDPKVDTTFGIDSDARTLKSASYFAENRDHFSARCAGAATNASVAPVAQITVTDH